MACGGKCGYSPGAIHPLFSPGFPPFIYDDKGRVTPLEVRGARVHPKPRACLTAEGVDSIEAAERLRGKVLYFDRRDVQLEEGRHFVQDLIGCEVLDADTGARYGELTDVIATGANDVWQVSEQGRDYLVPVIPEVVVSVDVELGRVELRPLEGIFDAD